MVLFWVLLLKYNNILFFFNINFLVTNILNQSLLTSETLSFKENKILLEVCMFNFLHEKNKKKS